MVITLRQILTNFAELFLDDMKIVYQPLRCRRDCAAGSNGFDQGTISSDQLAAIVFEARQQLSARFFRYSLVLGSEFPTVLFESLNAVDLGSNGLLIGVGRGLAKRCRQRL